MRPVSWLIVLCGMTVAPTLQAQSTLSSVVGTVRDPSGAALPAANVMMIQIETGVKSRTVSDAEGGYQILYLKPGLYSVTADKVGFGRSRPVEVQVHARDNVHVDVRVQLETVQQSMTVGGGAAVNSDDALIADTKNFEQVTQLPLNYRAVTTTPTSVLLTVPGVQHDRFNYPSIGGGLPGQIEYTIDGVSNVNIRFSGASWSGYSSPESLLEFRVTSVGAGAEYGQMADVTVVSKTGTNTVHGSAIWYHQNAALDATTYGSPRKQHKVFNTLGASIGAPVMIPGVYRGRNRTFFFIDYEANRQPASSLSIGSVPTPEMRSGGLSLLPGPRPVDPSNAAPFPADRIPATRINSVAARLLGSYVPLPNVPGESTFGNYRNLFEDPRAADGYDARIDHVFGPRHQLYGRWSSRVVHQAYDWLLLPASQLTDGTQNLFASHTFVARPSLVNELRFGIVDWSGQEKFPLRGAEAVAALGIEGLNMSDVGSTGGFPYFNFYDGTGFNALGHGRDTSTSSTTTQVTDNIIYMRGRHTMKFGADVRRLAYTEQGHAGGADDFGTFIFNQGAFTGNAFADLLLGLPTSTMYVSLGPRYRESTIHTHVYGQDQWRVNERLTVTFGLRWQVHPGMQESVGNLTNFDRRSGSVVIPDESLAPAPAYLAAVNACPGIVPELPCTRILKASDVGLDARLRAIRYNNFTPRLGVAYRPDWAWRSVIRGGFGAYTQTLLGPTAYGYVGQHSSDRRNFTNYQGPGIGPVFSLPQAYGGRYLLGAPGNAVFDSAINPTFRDPTSYQWNLTLEQSLTADITTRFSYIGVQSVGMPNIVNLNQVPASTTPYSKSRAPYPAWRTVTSLENTGFANYQGLQAEVLRRYRNGYFLQASYTLAKNIGNVGGTIGGRLVFPPEFVGRSITDPFNTRLDRGELAGARRHHFVLSGLFPLDFGKYAHDRFARVLSEGWSVSTIWLWETGQHQTPTISSALDQSNTDALGRGALARPDRVGDGNIPNPMADNFYDMNAFAPAPAGSGRFGNAGVGILRGPHTIALAAGLSRSFRITEASRLRFEATFTNLPNHPNFLAPNVDVTTPSSFGKLFAVQSAENSGNRTGQLGIRVDF